MDQADVADLPKCVVCQDNAACIRVVACNHLCLCRGCAARLQQTYKKCPVCRQGQYSRDGTLLVCMDGFI